MTYWELTYAVKQTRTDRMVNTVSYITFLQLSMHGQFAFCCDCQSSYRINVFYYARCYYFSVVQLSLLFLSRIHMCKETHDIRQWNQTIDQNESFMIIETANYKKINPTTPNAFFLQKCRCCV